MTEIEKIELETYRLIVHRTNDKHTHDKFRIDMIRDHIREANKRITEIMEREKKCQT